MRDSLIARHLIFGVLLENLSVEMIVLKKFYFSVNK